ncbi:hypothetical protein BD626DRAFT_573869 [Schizophyllum amplum]|uniref:Uncharacterized protein n=1 Tax=Schizophyllum amplum TaxID=97359 RepID=A0A550BYZ9_9AGAR|nr:hypothetical protein BD626DRAFT_574322 [Auriculariopsis ampla]TRM58050.1 hypothetical protein BD626DRAFT_573869 [Auriculariopsis ampla]
MCHVCDSSECGRRKVLTQVLEMGMTYAELWEQYEAEKKALCERYLERGHLAVRMKNLAELCPEVFASGEGDDEEAEELEEEAEVEGMLLVPDIEECT